MKQRQHQVVSVSRFFVKHKRLRLEAVLQQVEPSSLDQIIQGKNNKKFESMSGFNSGGVPRKRRT